MIKIKDDCKTEIIDGLADGGQSELIEMENIILQNRRKELGLTQQQVADLAHIQLRQYQRLESGERTMTGASMRIGLSVCCVLKLDPYCFMPQYQEKEKSL